MKNTTFTDLHKKFFKTPRTMQEVTDLFNGDIYAANAFQSVNLIGRNLKTVNLDGVVRGQPVTNYLFFVNYEWKDKTKKVLPNT